MIFPVRICLILVAGFTLIATAFASNKPIFKGPHVVRYKLVPWRAALSFEKPAKILFFGNSLTFVRDVPGRVEAHLNADTDLDRSALTGMVTFGGFKLIEFRDNPKARAAVLEALQATDWDLIVLQESFWVLSEREQKNYRDGVAWFASVAPKGPDSIVLYQGRTRSALLPYHYGLRGWPKSPEHKVELTQRLVYSVADRYGMTAPPLGRCWISHPQFPNLYDSRHRYSNNVGTDYIARVLARAISIKLRRDAGQPAPIFTCPDGDVAE